LIVLGLLALACQALSFNLPSAGDLVGTALATNGLGDLVEMATMLATSGMGDDAQALMQTMVAGGGDAQSMVETMMANGTAMPLETMMAGFGGSLYQDDFSDTGSGWPEVDSEGGTAGYAQSGYRINVVLDNYSVWGESGSGTYGDVSIEADATVLGGPTENEYGLICRYVDAENFYAATVASDGYFFFWKRVQGGDLEFIEQESGGQSAAINQGTASNHLRLDCVGTTLSLYANGELLAQVNDSNLAAGDVGLYAGTFDTAGTDVLFDNFVVSQP
jgi:hypothetical protein